MKYLLQNRKLLGCISILFMAYVIYLFMVLNPALYLIKSYREFFTDIYFFKQYFSFPGNPVEYVARFLTQFYRFTFVASLLIAILLLFIYLLGVSTLKFNSKNYQLPFLLVFLLIVMHNDYGHSIKFDINLICLLLALWLYFQNQRKHALVNLLLFASLLGSLLFLNGIVIAMLFGIMALLAVFLFRQKKINLIVVLVGVFLVSGLFHFLFYLSFRDVKQELVDILRIYSFPLLPFIFYLSIPIVFIFNSRWKISDQKITKQCWMRRRGFMYPLTVVVFGLIIFLTLSMEQRKVLLVQHYALEKNWDKVLEYSHQCKLADKNVAYCTNEALYRTGRIYDEIFNYFQGFGSEGLMSTEEIIDYSQIVPNQNVFLQLGALSLSVVWGIEASNVYGANPYVLKILAKAYLAGGEIKEARKMLNLLDNSLFNNEWVEQYQKFILDTALIETDPELQRYRSNQLPESLVYSHNVEMNLYMLSRTSTTNKMAYDYLLISTMLDHRIENFASCLKGMKAFGYQSIPKLFFEGIIYLSLYTDQISIQIKEFSYDRNTISRFGAFRQKLSVLKNDKEKAQKELFEEFGDTYWYYLLYKSSISEQARSEAFAQMIL